MFLVPLTLEMITYWLQVVTRCFISVVSRKGALPDDRDHRNIDDVAIPGVSVPPLAASLSRNCTGTIADSVAASLPFPRLRGTGRSGQTAALLASGVGTLPLWH